MASKIKVDQLETVDGTGNITVNQPLSGSGAGLTSLPAANLTGTIADARFPATLPATSGANLTALPAANITGTLPAISGANLTGILPAVGTSGNVLTSTGSAWASTAAAGGGAWSVKESGTMSGQSLLNITGLTKTTKIILENVYPSTSGYLYGRCSTNNGVSYDSNGNYGHVRHGMRSDSVSVISVSGSTGGQTYMFFMVYDTNNTAGAGIYAEITIADPAGAAYTVVQSQMSSSLFNVPASFVDTRATNRYTLTTAVNAYQLYMNGTMTGKYCVLELN